MQQSEAIKRLLGLRQGRQTASKHALKFWIIIARTGWGETALFGTFLNTLSDKIKDQLALRDKTKDVDDLILFAICLDERFRERQREKNYKPQTHSFPGFYTTSKTRSTYKPRYENYVSQKLVYSYFQRVPTALPPITEPEPELMQVDRIRLTPKERRRCISTNACIYYDKQDHFNARCPFRGNENSNQ